VLRGKEHWWQAGPSGRETNSGNVSKEDEEHANFRIFRPLLFGGAHEVFSGCTCCESSPYSLRSNKFMAQKMKALLLMWHYLAQKIPRVYSS
jgi:hypothetical protein